MPTLQKRYNPSNKPLPIEGSWEEAVVDHETKEALITLIRRGWLVQLGNWEYRIKPVSEFQKRIISNSGGGWEDIVSPVHLSDELAALVRAKGSDSHVAIFTEGAHWSYGTVYRRNPDYVD